MSGVTREQLRPMDASLEGYAWLPRMLDKARAERTGVDVGTQFGCPIDHTCMARLGVGPDLVRELVARHGDDDDAILSELRRHGIPPPDEAWFDAPALEDSLQTDGLYLRVRRADELPSDALAGGRVFAGSEHGAAVSVVLVDAAPGHRQAPHTHPVEEVLAVVAGRATLHLGEVQARTVVAGEVVRIPARAEHWLECSGEDGVRGVAAFGATEVQASSQH